MGLLLLSACQRSAATAPPESPTTTVAATTDPASEVPSHPLSGTGHCCKGDACEGKRYHSAHDFAQDCSAMGATSAKWCAAECELVEQPYACTCSG